MAYFFSIIIVTYNRSQQLEVAINSILAQTFNDYEIIVVDDCSTDDTKDVVKKYDIPNFRFLQTPQNTGGPATPRNIGIKNATGSWICFCDSDDLFKENHLAEIHSLITSRKITKAVITCNAYLRVDNELTNNVYFKALDIPVKQVSLLRNWFQNHGILSTLCIDNNEVSLFDERASYRSVEDYFFILNNLISHRKHYYINKPTIWYSTNSNDSIRNSYTEHGKKLFRYKANIFLKRALWKRIDGICYAGIVLIDYAKYKLKSLISS